MSKRYAKPQLSSEERADLAKLQQHAVSRRRANAEPFPGPLTPAFASGPLELHGLTLRPIAAADWITLRRLNSPFYHQLVAQAEFQQSRISGIKCRAPNTKYQAADMIAAAYLFTRPSRQTFGKTAATLHEEALKFLSARISAPQLTEIAGILQLNLTQAFCTALEYGSPKQDGETEMHITGPSGGSKDGFGWWLNYVGRLAYHYHWPLEFIYHDLPMAHGFAYSAFAIESDGLHVSERVSKGYIAQEVDRLNALSAKGGK